MSKVIMFSHIMHSGKGDTSGPAIRTFNIAKALAKLGHEVTLAEKKRDKREAFGGITLVPWDNSLVHNIKNFDAACIQIWSNETEFLKEVSQIPLAVDVYAPYMIEHIYHDYNINRSIDKSRFRNDVLIPSLNPFIYGDVFLCANDRQRKFYLGMLTSLGRITPFSRDYDLVKIVPFGIRDEELKFEKKVLRNKKELKGKKIILWIGPLFPWYDPVTLLRAFSQVARQHENYALVFLGGINPKAPQYLINKVYKNAREEASSLGLLNKNVFFYDWVDYDTIKNVFFEAEFLVSTHLKTLEMEFSERGRILESIWGELPILCSEGDSLSEKVSTKRLGMTAKIEDEKDLAEKMHYLINNPAFLQESRKNMHEFKKQLSWDNLIGPLNEFCLNPQMDKNKRVFDVYSMIEDSRAELISGTKNISKKYGEILQSKEEEIDRLTKYKIEYGKVKSSIIYPLYKMTSSFGQTKIGVLIRRILKR